MPPIIIPQVHLSFGRYFWLTWRFTLKVKPSMWLILFPLILVGSTLQGLLSGRINLAASLGTILPLALCLAALLFIPWQMWQTYRRTPLLSGFNRYEFNEAGLQVQNALQQTQLHWSGMQKVHRFGQWLLLLSGPQVGLYIDLQQVQAPHTADDVLRALDQHGIKRA